MLPVGQANPVGYSYAQGQELAIDARQVPGRLAALDAYLCTVVVSCVVLGFEAQLIPLFRKVTAWADFPGDASEVPPASMGMADWLWLWGWGL